MSSFLNSIVGRPADGQRKMAVGVYVISILGFIVLACLAGIIFGAEAKLGRAPLLQLIASGALGALSATFGLLIAGNVGEHYAKKNQQ